jgi:hypothetical protein
MATVQLQHYVPRFLLRRFGSGKKDRVHVFDKHTDTTFSSAATKLAAMNNFYDFEFMGSLMSVETMLSHVESKAGKHIANIIKNCQLNVDDPLERGELAAFLAIQMVRTPATTAMYGDMFTRMEDWLRANGAPKEFFNPDPAVGEGENAQRAMMAKNIVNAPIDFGPAFIDKDWLLLQTDNKHPYLIGDHPLIMHNMVKQEGRGNLGVGVEGIEIYFPLSPALALAIWCPSHRQLLMDTIQRFDDPTESNSRSMKNFTIAKDNALKIVEAIRTGKALRSAPENVEFFNSLQIATAERFIFSSNDNFSLVKDMVRTNPELRHGRRMHEATGKF